ncbi:type IV pilin [Halolamina salifodinae]|uniref:Flagellin-like protein n=1 Tax=Halolamina salifodinae TaxID=1202767 RepID=A0A8T4GUW1_9EURY|nr:type IV pilin [Halolamina salifodinae]MBP1986180.1 flagellin-like protein [Halolamina salifodinae]
MPEGRGVSPIVGVVLMVVLTLMLTSVLATGVMVYGDGLDSDAAVPTAPNSSVTETIGAGRWLGGPEELFRLSNDEANATDVSMRVNFTIKPNSSTIGNSLNSVYMETTNGSLDMFSGTERADLERIAVDTDGDGSADRDITGDVNGWTVTNDGSALKVELTGSAYSAAANDSVLLTFGGVRNPPEPGSYELRAETSGDGNWHRGNITVT